MRQQRAIKITPPISLVAGASSQPIYSGGMTGFSMKRMLLFGRHCEGVRYPEVKSPYKDERVQIDTQELIKY